ncbi:MAG: hypothetical protein MJY99_11825 [Fibrobacter sp.]|nr:hypothetical protein [Fibrobacter sp.]
MRRYFNFFAFALFISLAICLNACSEESSAYPEKSYFAKGSVFEVVDSEYESGELVSVVAYDSKSGDTLRLNVADYDEEKERYYLEVEDSEDMFAAKVGKDIVKIIEVNPDMDALLNTEKKSSSSKKSTDGKSSSSEKSTDAKSSSSNSAKSSSNSSEEESSSSERAFSLIEENEEMSFDLSKMKMVDKRDGREYDLRLDDTTLSMAVNLQYETYNSYCYNNYEKNCERFGRLYEWQVVFDDYIGHCYDRDKSTSVCPKGWYVNQNPIEGLYSGYRDSKGFFSSLLEVGWAWIDSSMIGTRTCYDTTSARVNATCVDDSCGISPLSGGAYKKYAIAVTCFYTEPIYVPDGVTLPEPKPVPVYGKAAPLTTYKGPFGELIDERDGNIYKTVEIGTQTWMAENLKYYIDSSFYSENQKRGRMYSWYKANNVSGSKFVRDTVEWPVQGVCPNGWHIPTMDDWKTLFNLVLEATNGAYLNDPLLAVQWDSGVDGGIDAYGFGIRESGTGMYKSGRSSVSGGGAEFMISDKDLTNEMIVRFYDPNLYAEGGFYESYDNQYVYTHIRCVKGQGSRPILPPKPEKPESSADSVATEE